MNFAGRSLALSPDGVASSASSLGVALPEIGAVISVETNGAGFLPNRYPKILFERHIFSRLTNGQWDASNPDISSPDPGGYGASGMHQYDRLTQAMSLDNDAALQSASWGIGQVLGSNFQMVGFNDVTSMVAAMVDSEDQQLAAVAAYINSAHLSASLRVHDWASFAKGYNGPNYSVNRYDIQLNGFYQKYLTGASPDLHVRAAQIYLSFRNFDPHGIDGIMGPGTQAAIKAFQGTVGLPVTGVLDDATFAALIPE